MLVFPAHVMLTLFMRWALVEYPLMIWIRASYKVKTLHYGKTGLIVILVRLYLILPFSVLFHSTYTNSYVFYDRPLAPQICWTSTLISPNQQSHSKEIRGKVSCLWDRWTKHTYGSHMFGPSIPLLSTWTSSSAVRLDADFWHCLEVFYLSTNQKWPRSASKSRRDCCIQDGGVMI